MITSFKLKNLTTEDQVVFGQEVGCDYLYQSGGVDWETVPAQHNTYKYIKQIGSSIYSSELNERVISITAWIYYVLSKEEREGKMPTEWVGYGYERIKQQKGILNEIINPMHFLRLTTGGYYIEGKPEATPQFGIEDSDNNLVFCKFSFSIFCNNPMFKKETNVIKSLQGDYPAFHFPFTLTDMGYIMGTRIDYLRIVVENEGNVEIGGIITLHAKGTIINPKVKNIETEEQFVINKTLNSGETVIINTVEGKDKGVFGIINGVKKNYLQYWSFSNNWIKFQKGTSLIEYSTENSSEDNLEVTIEINPEKFALEEM